MAVTLEGGCRVTDFKEGRPTRNGTLSAWLQVGRAVGAQAISLRTLEFAKGLSPGLRNCNCDEIIYVLEGEATIFLNGLPYQVEAETGIYLRPGDIFTAENRVADPLVLISSQCPEPSESFEVGPACTSPSAQTMPPTLSPIVRLADREAVTTSDRWYRVLVDEKAGSAQVTQFVGSIPPGRAPDHFHHYEEVLFILRGIGMMWAGDSRTPIAAGSCIYLPKRQVHCVENTGKDELRLLGVFYPAGSPAVRYETD